MTEQLNVTTERVDDIPILLAQSETMGIPELLDAYFKPHGNWEGSSLGWTTAVWLAHILSEGDHRMNQVQPWVAPGLATLHSCMGQQVQELYLLQHGNGFWLSGKRLDKPVNMNRRSCLQRTLLWLLLGTTAIMLCLMLVGDRPVNPSFPPELISMLQDVKKADGYQYNAVDSQ